ncbi:TetR-like C-terminal domain-containing protein [Williamsia sp. 1138]|uniref:TetR/AcrR family transcriptional regulator n=1 Tax=Williamsia sp. 1138 TaxID=1903117 RepID=UPI0011815CE9|nr:TetR-like C-terminal domain-containing protein [Williamsia sp. 1138]
MTASEQKSTAPAARRRRVNHEAVIAAAQQMVDELGPDALTMTALASVLGVRVSSLYNHVKSLDEIKNELQLRAMRELGDLAKRAAMGRTGVDGLRVLARVFVDYAAKWPHRCRSLTRVPADTAAFSAASAEAGEALAVMIRTAGVADERVLQTQLALFAAISGFVTLQLSGFFTVFGNADDVFEQILRGAVTAAVVG